MHAMAWSMVNFPLADRNALYGTDEEQRNALLHLLVDGWSRSPRCRTKRG
jgi:hypothetical protein